jgi:DNA-binding beta-propeller fold protein YncE
MPNMEFRVVGALLAAGLAFSASAQDQFLVSDYDGNKIVRFEWPSYQPVDHFVGNGLSPLKRATTMVIGPGGDLFVTSNVTNEVLRYDGATGKYLGSFISGLNGPGQILWGPDGNLYVANFNTDSVLRYSPAGQFIDVFVGPGAGGLDGANGIVFTKGGDLLVSSYNNDKVLRYNGQTGAFKEEVNLAGLGADGPYYLTLGTDGSVYVPCRLSNRVVKIDPQGVAAKFIEPAQGNPDGPLQVATDPEGRLLVTAYDTRVVVRYEEKFGQLLGVVVPLGTGGLGNAAGILFLPPPDEGCRADFDGNGILDLFDFLAFVNVFNAGC